MTTRIEQFHQLAKLVHKLEPLEMSADAVIGLDKEIHDLTIERYRFQEENKRNYAASQANADLAINLAKDFAVVIQERDQLLDACEEAKKFVTKYILDRMDDGPMPTTVLDLDDLLKAAITKARNEVQE